LHSRVSSAFRDLEHMADTETAVGTVLATRYRLEQALGEGGMGRVFAAVDQQLGRRVAVKLIRDDMQDDSARDRFLREARAAAVLTHPNACQLFEVAEHEGNPFLVMELLQGESLADRLARERLSKDEAIATILPLMDALTKFHEAGLIHRDLKPSNVFLTPQGVKLLDFGLARRTQRSDAVTAPALTVPGAIAGTMRYMAPEQLTGDPVDARTDVFAIGVMLYEMLTGRVPFGHGSNADWLNAVLTKDPPPLGDPALATLDPIVSRALQRRPEDRFQSVEEIAAALRELNEEPPKTAANAPPPAAAATSGVRAVVLPFQLLQDDPDLAPLKDGVPEVLTALLSGKGGREFLSNRVAQQFASETDLMAVGRSLKVDQLITGSVLHDGDELRVTVQLIDTKDGSVQWSQTKRHTLASVLAVQDEICKAIVDAFPVATDSETADAVR